LAANPITIDKDQTVEIKIPKTDNVKTAALSWEPYDFKPGDEVQIMWHPIAEKNGVEELVTNANNPEVFYSALYNSHLPRSENSIFSVPIEYTSGLTDLRLKCIYKTSNVSANNGVYMTVNLTDGDNEIIHVPQDNVTIEVVGHYNNTERKLSYTVSRQSGTIMDVFDFGVFSQSSLRK